MADATQEQEGPERSGRDGTDFDARRAAARRRILEGGLLTAPVMITLGARRAYAVSGPLAPSVLNPTNYGLPTNGTAGTAPKP